MKRIATILLLSFLSEQLSSQLLQNNLSLVSFRSNSYDSIRTKKEIVPLSYSVDEWIKNKKPAKATLGYSKQGRKIEAYYFPGTSEEKALVIGGMHGSELSAIEIANNLIKNLSNGELPYYNVVVIPVLFPDNADKALKIVTASKSNFGRYTNENAVDPNRQMPELGKSFDPENPLDSYGREIENENQYLLQLIQEYQPSRVVNLHAINDATKAGIYADPRTDCKGYALGFATDSSLAISMADYIERSGGYVPGNHLSQSPTALYYNDPEIAPMGSLQKRNLHGSPLPNNRGYGVSLGAWATTAVCDGTNKRDASILITIEFPGYKPSIAYEGEKKKYCLVNIEAYTSAVRKIFLEQTLTY